ncbi:MAG: GAF domain-containing protein [Chloroflexota bacterium]
MVSAVLAIYHLTLAICFAFIPAIRAASEVIQLNVTVGIMGVVLFLLFKRAPAPPKYANLILSSIILFAVINALYYLSFSREMRQSIFLLFVMIGASQFFLSIRWFSFMMAITLGSWFLIAWQLLGGSVFYFGFILFVGAAAAVVVFVVRRDAHHRFEWLRRKDLNRQKVLQYRAQQLEKSQAIAWQIGSILTVDQLLDQTVELIAKQFDFSFVNLFLLDGDQKLLELRAYDGDYVDGENHISIELPIDESNLQGWVVKNGRYRHTPDVSDEALYTSLFPQQTVGSQLDLPLRDGRGIFGVLSLQWEHTNGFDSEDILYLQLLASQVANSIRNATSYQRERSARRLAETLQETGNALASTLEWDAIIDMILGRLFELVHYDRAAVLVQNENQLEFVAFRGFPESMEPRNIFVQLENESIFKQIVETKRPYSLQDALEHPDWQAVGSFSPARSWLGVPLIQSGAVIGMLSLTRETLNPYQKHEVELAATFAGQAAIALENARLYEETTRFNQQLEYEVRQRTEAIQIAYEELEQLNRNKSDFISVVSHELRTPLTILHGYTQMLLQDKIILEDQMRRTLVKGIETGSGRLADIINSMLDVVKIENKELNLFHSQVSIPAMSKMVMDDLFDLMRDRNLTLNVEEMPDVPLIYADPDMMKKVLYHLLINAVKYTPDGGTITVQGKRYKLAGGVLSSSVEIVVKDSGIGIDSSMRELIFTKFYQTGEVSLHSSSKTQFKGGGPGLGLAIVKGIVEAHNGRIWVESRGYDETGLPGSEFHIVLPINWPESDEAAETLKQSFVE